MKTIIADFDGTLAPIRLNPNQVKMSQAMRKTLLKLHLNGFEVIVLSSRPLDFLKSRLPSFVKIISSRGNTIKVKKTQVNKIYKHLKITLKHFPVRIKEKKIGIVAHYRTLPENKVEDLEEFLRSYCELFNLQFIRGRKAVEITPKNVQDKIETARKLANSNTIFFGDDDSDAQAAFQVILKGGTAYLVKTKERHYTPPQVKLLTGITQVRKTLQKLTR